MENSNSGQTSELTQAVEQSLEDQKTVQISYSEEYLLSARQVVALFATVLFRYGMSEKVAFEVTFQVEPQADAIPLTRSSICVDFSEDPSFSKLVSTLDATPSIPETCALVRCFVPYDLSRWLYRLEASTVHTANTRAVVYGGARLELAYSGGIYSDEIATQISEHCGTLLKAAIEFPNRPVSQLQMMHRGELHAILAESRSDLLEFERATIPDVFEQQVLRNPDAPALRYHDQIITYGELHSRASQAAGRLQALSVGPEILVGVYLVDPIALAVAYVGIVTAGGVLVALDPEWPSERLRQVIEEASPACIVTSAELAPKLASLTPPMVMDLDRPTHGATFRKPELTPDNAAYVVFTSGSTGAPKGVVGLHRTITAAARLSHLLRKDELFALSSNLAFGAGVIGLFFPLMQGAAVLLVPSLVARDLPALVRMWEVAKVTRIVLVAPQLRQLILLGKDVAVRLRNVTTIALSGAVLTPDMLPAIYDLFPQAMVINAYSCLEIGTMATRWETKPDNRARELTIGRAMPNTRIYILGPRLKLLPAGMPGEICVASGDLSRGYLHRPELTSERFVPNPFDAPGMPRLYRTGDVGRVLPNGELEYLGRIDNQVKIRGIRIELEEIELAIQKNHEVFQAAVLAIPQAGESRLVAYVSAKTEHKISVSSLRERLEGCLPSYMVPALFVLMDGLPMTGNGKIDRQRLPTVVSNRPEVETVYMAPRDSLEASVTAIWERELGIEGIGVADHFLEIGGDSLVAVRIALRIQQQFGCALSPLSLLEHPTIEDLVEELRGHGAPQNRSQVQPASA